MTGAAARTRRVIVVDNSHVARRVGDRIRQARIRTGMTQAQVAHGRYTAAYISALERGLAKPSMAALSFLSERLGVSVPDLVAEERPAMRRLEADLLLASGRFQEALDQYDTLLDEAGEDRRQRAELMRGRSEALCRLGRGSDAIRPAAESAEAFDALGAPADAAWSRYWLASAQYQEDNPAEARGILLELLGAERSGLEVAPDFRFRLLTSIGHVEMWDGQPERALSYMEEARVLLESASLRQRAAFLSGLALQYRHVGDLERSIVVGHEALALYRAADAERDQAALENNLAITFMELGNLERAMEHLERASTAAESLDDDRLRSEVAEARARAALARGDIAEAEDAADRAIALAAEAGSYLAAVGGHLIRARVAAGRDDTVAADAAFERAAGLLREHGARSLLRTVLAEWGEARSGWGDLSGANSLYAEALGRSRTNARS
jgi:tetratricopeptide (TPR) repeat protein